MSLVDGEMRPWGIFARKTRELFMLLRVRDGGPARGEAGQAGKAGYLLLLLPATAPPSLYTYTTAN